MICRNCDREFDPKRKIRGGYIYLCDDCSEEDIPKHLGVHGAISKSSNIEVVRNNHGFWRSVIRKVNRRSL